MTPSEPEPPSLDERKFAQDTADKKRELDIREREVAAKESELHRSRWFNPVTLGLFAATLGLMGNMVVVYLTNDNSRKLERIRAQSNLALDAVRTGTGKTDDACKNLLFLVNLGLLDDANSTIRHQCDTAPKGPPSLPVQGGGAVSALGLTSSAPWDVSGYVTDESNVAISGAKVTAVQSLDTTMPAVAQFPRNVLGTTQTDAGGAFTLKGMPVGSSYVLTAEKDGFELGSQTVFAYTLNYGSVRIILKKKK